MPRRLAVIAVALLATAAYAQRRGPVRAGSPEFLAAQVDAMDAAIRAKSAAVRRDSEIVSQLVAAVGELDDFQRTVAIEKARDHVNNAERRAREPIAPQQTFNLLRDEGDLIDKARQQGGTADFAALKHDLMHQTHSMQQTLFVELDDLRKDRQTLSDLQSRLSSLTNDMDNALAVALGSTFDYFKAGGQ